MRCTRLRYATVYQAIVTTEESQHRNRILIRATPCRTQERIHLTHGGKRHNVVKVVSPIGFGFEGEYFVGEENHGNGLGCLI